jgi:hypothetical protein
VQVLNYLVDAYMRTTIDLVKLVFSLCPSFQNDVPERVGTILSDDINIFVIFIVSFLWPQFGNLIVTLFSLC